MVWRWLSAISSFFAPEIRRARSWPRRLPTSSARRVSAPFRPAAIRPARSIPDAIELLIDLGYETANFRSKSWMEFSRPGAPRARYRDHGLRQRRARNLSGLARASDDGALGHARSGADERPRRARGLRGDLSPARNCGSARWSNCRSTNSMARNCAAGCARSAATAWRRSRCKKGGGANAASFESM